MVVWRFHGTEPPAEHLTHMHERLREIATRQLGEIYVDDHMRNIPDHYHAHGRPKGGFFGHGLRRPGCLIGRDPPARAATGPPPASVRSPMRPLESDSLQISALANSVSVNP